jgi:hypothetical protein
MHKRFMARLKAVPFVQRLACREPDLDSSNIQPSLRDSPKADASGFSSIGAHLAQAIQDADGNSEFVLRHTAEASQYVIRGKAH